MRFAHGFRRDRHFHFRLGVGNNAVLRAVGTVREAGRRDVDGALVLAAEGMVTVFDGHYPVRVAHDDAGSGEPALAQLRSADRATVSAVRAERHITAPPQRHTEAGLVRRLEGLGIGRPSTWGAIVAVLQERGYALLYERRLVPTERGRVLSAFLEHGFGRWMDYGFTAALPDDEDVLGVGINRAIALIADKEMRLSRARGPNRVLRELGRHPDDGAPVWLKTGHYGPFVAHRRRYASLPDGLEPAEVALDDAVALLATPDVGGR